MSLTGRPRVTVNGIRRTRTFHYFWCQSCRRAVRIASTNLYGILCPYCFRELGLELDISRPRLVTDLRGIEPSPAARLLENLASVLDPLPSIRRRPNTDFGRRLQWVSETEDGPVQQSWITPGIVGPPPPPRPISLQENVAPRNNNINDATPDLFGDPLIDFIDEMALQNDWRGPPPLAASAIEALPRVKVLQMHLDNDPTCPVCKEEFELGGEVIEMPCKHFYHSDCIVPWLRIHNTCPVCRYELQDTSNNDLEDANDEGFGIEDATNGLMDWLRSRLFSLWPFRALSDWRQRSLQEDSFSYGGK